MKRFYLFITLKSSLIILLFSILISMHLLAGNQPGLNTGVTPITRGILENDSLIIGTGGDSSTQVPLAPWWGYSFTQTLYHQSEINIPGKRIYRIGYQYNGASASCDFEVEVWMAHTSLTELTASVPLSEATKLYDGPYVVNAGEEYSEIDIDPFFYNNTDNLIITIIEKMPGYYTPDDMFYCTFTTESLCVGARNDQSPYDPNNLPAGFPIYERANIKLMLEDVPTVPIAKIIPESLDFGQVETTLNKILPVRMMNIGGAPLEITGAEITDSHYTLVNASFPVILQPGESQMFDVQFLPTDPGLVEAALTFLMDPSVTGSKTCLLTGVGLRFGVLREGFEGELFPPLGWKVYDVNNDNEGWYRNIDDAPTGQTVPHTGIAAAGLDTYAGSPGVVSYNDWLVTPKMIWQTGDVFNFFIKRLANQDGQTWKICLSITGDQPSNFTPFDVITDPPLSWTEKSYDLSTLGLTNGQEFYIAFQFNSVWCWPGVIDDVLGSVKLTAENDLMAVSFTGNDIIYENTVNNFTAVVGNSGLVNVPGGVYEVKACAVVNGIETVFGTVTGPELEPGENATLNLPVTIATPGVYNLYAKIFWTGDMNPLNNLSDELGVEVIGNSIIVKNIGDYPPGQQTPYYNLYPLNFGDFRGASLSECIYYTNELNTGGIINRLSWYTAAGSLLPGRKIKVWMAETDLQNFDQGGIPASQMTLVYDGQMTFMTGVYRVNLELTQPFTYSGSKNLVVMAYYYQGGNPYIVDNVFFAYQEVESGPSRTGFDNWYTTVNPEDLSHFSYVANYPLTSLMFETGNGLGTLNGQVFYDENPGPVEGARVEIANADFPGNVAVVYTNSDGFYEIPYAMAGNNLTVTISKFGFIDVVFENVALAPGQTVTLEDAHMVVRPEVALSGSVIKSDTQTPAQGALVKLTGVQTYETTTNNNGEFAFDLVWGLTEYQIEVTLNGYQTYSAEVTVSNTNLVLDPITLLENAPPPHLVNAAEEDGNAVISWYGAGSPFPWQFRYDDGISMGRLITPGAPTVVVGSAWPDNSIVTGVQWFTASSPGYPNSPQVMITVLGLNPDRSPNPNNVLAVFNNIPNNTGWNSLDFLSPVPAPNGFFVGISGYSNYIVMSYDDGVGEPYEFIPYTQWSNGMGAYYPLETVTSPPLFANIFVRASGLLYEIPNYDRSIPVAVNLLTGQPANQTYICEASEPMYTGEPEIPAKYFKADEIISFQHYNVFRKKTDQTEWEQINTEPVTDTVFTDTGWGSLENGFYIFGVEAEYLNGVKSEMAGSNVIQKVIIGVDESTVSGLEIFPNPSSGTFNINSEAEMKNLQIFDNTGRIVQELLLSGTSAGINLNYCISGFYLVRVETEKGTVTRKISIR